MAERRTVGGAAMTSTEAAQRLGVSATYIRAIAQRHNIGSKPGRDWLFTARDMVKLRRHIRRGREA